MSDWSKKDLDRLFQQGMEQDHFEYNPVAWEQMEALLERDRRRRRVIIWWWSGVAAVLFIAVGLWILIPSESPEKIKTSTDTHLPQANQSELDDTPMQTEQRSGELPFQNSEETNNDKNARASVKPGVSKEKQRQKEPPVVLQEKSKNEPAELQKTELIVNKSDVAGTNSIEKINAQPAINTGIKSDTRIQMTDLELLSPLDLETIESFNKSDYSIHLTTTETSPTDVAETKRGEFVLGLRGGGELTSVGADDFSRRSWNAGIFAEYRLAGKYSLGLGANFIRNQYRAGQGEYVPEKGFWTRGIAPASTEGMCNIIELPMQLSYFSHGYRQNGLFLNAGITSYIMLREDYYYHYDTYDPDLIRWWATDKTTQYWFGIAQFSVGYNKMLGNKTSVQFAPYFQVPLSGVGHGHVRLYSIGTSLRFNLHVK